MPEKELYLFVDRSEWRRRFSIVTLSVTGERQFLQLLPQSHSNLDNQLENLSFLPGMGAFALPELLQEEGLRFNVQPRTMDALMVLPCRKYYVLMILDTAAWGGFNLKSSLGFQILPSLNSCLGK